MSNKTKYVIWLLNKDIASTDYTIYVWFIHC